MQPGPCQPVSHLVVDSSLSCRSLLRQEDQVEASRTSLLTMQSSECVSTDMKKSENRDMMNKYRCTILVFLLEFMTACRELPIRISLDTGEGCYLESMSRDATQR